MSGINVQIHGIELNSNSSINGQLVGSDFILYFRPQRHDDKLLSISIEWEIKINATSDTYVIHRSSTLFTCDGIIIDNLILSNESLDLFAQLAQVALYHTRMMFLGQNPQTKTPLPMMWLHQLKPTIKEQLIAFLN